MKRMRDTSLRFMLWCIGGMIYATGFLSVCGLMAAFMVCIYMAVLGR